MPTSPLLNPPRRTRLLWPNLLAALGCMIFINASAQTAPAGMHDGVASAATTNSAPTYLRDIQPIFMGNCSSCHNHQSRFVYDWLDYKTAYADRWEIKRRLWDSWRGSYYKEPMPVSNSPESLALTDAQRETIKNWVESGAAEGVAPATAA